MREFTSDAAEQEGEPPATFTLPAIKFTLDGEEFRCLKDMTGDALLEWSELATAAADDTPADSPEGAAYLARFFRATFGTAEYARLRRHFRTHKTPTRIVLAIASGIQEELTAAVEDATGRPTAPPSPSSPGDEGKAAARARVVSLSRGEVTFVDPPPAKAKPARRAASSGA